jgi:hypothetical protein
VNYTVSGQNRSLALALQRLRRDRDRLIFGIRRARINARWLAAADRSGAKSASADCRSPLRALQKRRLASMDLFVRHENMKLYRREIDQGAFGFVAQRLARWSSVLATSTPLPGAQSATTSNIVSRHWHDPYAINTAIKHTAKNVAIRGTSIGLDNDRPRPRNVKPCRSDAVGAVLRSLKLSSDCDLKGIGAKICRREPPGFEASYVRLFALPELERHKHTQADC